MCIRDRGYDVDINCTDTVVADNLSHHNDGGFILLCTSGDIGGYNNGITVERNISIDDSGQIFTLSGTIKNIRISNNRVSVEKNIHTRLIGTYQWGEKGGGPENVTVTENYIYMNTDGENRFFDIPPRSVSYTHLFWFIPEMTESRCPQSVSLYCLTHCRICARCSF